MRCHICDYVSPRKNLPQNDYLDTSSKGGPRSGVSYANYADKILDRIEQYQGDPQHRDRRVFLDKDTGKYVCSVCAAVADKSLKDFEETQKKSLDKVEKPATVMIRDKVKKERAKRIKPGCGPCITLDKNSPEFKELEDRLLAEGVINTRAK